eukprot:CAMPEP_0176395242 /NCGR_PEP_ID=MMETSP0126-20121128/43252_1 /TAXON_ID=141414 ORGANISM="Strombidinopsis acuminatum, Strain SPMC142" /NCGR_SAMPLE_ID=MMETSP0126 /ASSEMBLY_ACC=CAM_ASM_000229 /LENGTH=42 /DNA_ID= /DNA_START= /DNA_END= /DNA_ORIENTATION=
MQRNVVDGFLLEDSLENEDEERDRDFFGHEEYTLLSKTLLTE